MSRQQGITICLLMFGLTFISLGMAFKPKFDYAPIFGWGLGLFTFLIDIFYMRKHFKNKK
ncbi:hypothetical protein [Priestia megaterium]|uniref:hypothetical protein n=1 Tax=Priestia megaterium TaxID=1404 RepID=UPI0027952B10|nr:hypothetical protein [Priestia megaterium]